MKVGKTEGTKRTRSVGPYADKPQAASAAPRVAAAPPASAAATASVLGIPEAEFTPRVRDAIMTLMHEVDRLKHELDQARSRVEDLARAADQDMLLPILNRRAFVREITRFIGFSERYGTPAAVIYFDLNNFKAVNDTYGHPAGDSVLRHFADLVAGQIRDTDILARIGGDEFGVILSHVNVDQATKKASSLVKSLHDRPPVWQGKPVPLSFSYGVYELKAGEQPDQAIASADRAMYDQKNNPLKR